VLIKNLHIAKRKKIVKHLEKTMRDVVQGLGQTKAFSDSLHDLQSGMTAGIFNGGFGNYRSAKAALYNKNIHGIISAASQYENTESVLDVLSAHKNLPFLSLRFDGENNPVNRLKLKAFLEWISDN
jgi:hypothetical protein